MEINSRQGEGTTVRIWLPLSWKAAASAQTEAIPVQEQVALQILVVDDDELIQSTITRMIQSLGHSTRIAGSGEEAIELLEGGLCADTIILDLNMPGIGGVAALARIRELCPTVPVVICTGRADQSAVDLTKSNKRVTLLAKPFTIDGLRKVLAMERRADLQGVV